MTDPLNKMEQQAEPALLPCPFCGSTDIRFSGGDDDDRYGVAVQCMGCDCAMGANWDRDAMPDHAYRCETDAAEAWNRRAATVMSPASTDSPDVSQKGGGSDMAEVSDAEIIALWDAWPRQGITSRSRAVEFARKVLALRSGRTT